MGQGKLSRRGFWAASIAALCASAGLPAWYAREVVDRRRAGGRLKGLYEPIPRVAPSDKIALGAIGVGGQGYRLMTEAPQKRSDVALVAACDVDAVCLAEAIGKSRLPDVAAYRDFRDLLARDDIDAVTIATPDHWHALIAVAAMRAGKDVYCEKPLTLTIDEGKVLRDVAAATGRILQVGSHQRSDARFRLACELARNGRIGAIERIETRIGSNPKHKRFAAGSPPEGLDWDLWLGQAPKVSYMKERCRYNFRWWFEYSGGKLTDWGAHHNDIAQWALGMDRSGPTAVQAQGTPVGTDPRGYACPVDFTVAYRYACGARLVSSSQGKNGVKLVGSEGWIFVDRAGIEASDPRLIDAPLARDAVRLHSSDDHIKDFLDCTRSRSSPVCDVETGHRSATVCHLGNIALRLGESLVWDPSTERFIANPRGDALLSRPMRRPWTLSS